VLAQSDTNHAGLVIAFPDGTTHTYCIPFVQPDISGLDLLIGSGLDVKVQAYGGLGAEVCEIGSAGCDYPSQACACQSYGPGGVYWSYFHLTNGRWVASITGAGSYQVHDGDVEGWAYSAGKPPAVYTFSQLCPVAPPQPNPTNTRIPVKPTLPPTRAILPTHTTIAPTHKPLPTATVRRVTPTSKPAPPTAAPPAPTAQQPTPAPTITPQPTISPALTLAATSASTAQPTQTALIPTPTPTPTPTSTPTPTIRNPEDVARNAGILIGAVVLGSLAVWGIIGVVRRGRQGGGSDVE
jgi:hypothetical protein